MQRNNNVAGDYINQGNSHYAKKKFEQAITCFTQAIKLEPLNGSAFFYRGKVFYATGMFNQAITDLTTAIEINPKDAAAFYWRFYAYLNKWKNNNDADADDEFHTDYLALAADLYTYTVELDHEICAAFQYGDAVCQQREFEQAIIHYTQAANLDREAWEAYHLIGQMYHILGKFDLAIHYHTVAIEGAINQEKDLKYISALYSDRRLSYSALGKFELAMLDFTTVSKLDNLNTCEEVAHSNVKKTKAELLLAQSKHASTAWAFWQKKDDTEQTRKKNDSTNQLKNMPTRLII